MSFLGAVIIIRPGTDVVAVGSMLIVVASAFLGTTMLLLKVLSRTESAVTNVVYMNLFLAVFSLLPAIYVWVWPTFEHLVWFMLIGLVTSIAHLAIAQAFREAEVVVITPIWFTRLIWAALIGFVVFAEVPGVGTWVGAGLIIGSAAYIAIRETKSPFARRNRVTERTNVVVRDVINRVLAA